MSAFDIFINAIIVSIPEEICLVIMILILLKRYDYIDKYNLQENISKIFFRAVLPIVILFNLTLYGLNLNLYIKYIINSIGLSLIMIVFLHEKRIIKIFFYSALSFALSSFMEVFTVLVLMYIFNFNPSVVNASPFINFALLIPLRLIQISVFYTIYVKKNSIKKISIIDMWHNNGIFRRFAYVYTITNLFIVFHFYNKFVIEKSIANLNSHSQMTIITTLFSVFVLEMVIPWIAIYVVYPSEKLRKSIK